MQTRKFRNFGLISLGIMAGVLLSLGLMAVAQRETPLPLEELRQLSSVFGAIKNNYVEEVDDKSLIKGAISGMVSHLDPHSSYLDVDDFRELQTITQGEFGGLGLEVSSEDGFVKVISPIEDTPAARAGIKSGDLIVKIDHTPTKGLSLTEAVKLMRGEPNKTIVLTLMRAAHPQPIVLTLMREIIKVRSVRSKMLENQIGYVRIAQFQEKTGADLIRQLKALGQSAPPQGLVLDLRNDPGGLLSSAIGVSSAFLPPESLIVSTHGRTSDAQRKYLAVPAEYARDESDYLANLPEWIKKVPMVILVNVGSASASEIVAGALQDYQRAKILGNRTFGKGSVQVILPLSEDTAVKLTVSRYFTPKGRSIQAMGIEPDVVVADTNDGDLFRLPREADLLHHLTNDQKNAIVKPSAEQKLVDTPKFFEFGGKDDFQLKQAINLLEGKPIQTIAKSHHEGVEAKKTIASPHSLPATKQKSAVPVEHLKITPSGVESK